MNKKIAILMIVILLLGLTSAWAGNDRRRGTAGATELLIPVGSRGTAMGGAVVSNTYGVEAIYWNPAGLAWIEGTEAMFTHQPYLADIDVNFVGVGTNIEGFGALAASAKIVSVGDMEETTDEMPDGTGRFFSPTLSVLGISYARILTGNVSFGATAMFVHENIFEVTASGMAFDVGFMYDPRWHGVKLGVAIKNYGPRMGFDGRGFDVSIQQRQLAADNKEFEMPSHFNLGVSYDFLNMGPHLATVSGNFRSNNFSEDCYQGGAEYVYNSEYGKYSLRAGYVGSKDDEYLYGASLGAGVTFDLESMMLSFEYSWNQTEVFEDNQFFTIKAQF